MSASFADPEGADPLNSILRLDAAVFDALPVGVYACDAAGRIVRANRRACELWGRSPSLNSDQERFCGAFRLFTLDGQPLSRAAAPMAKALAEGVGLAGLEAVVENPDGRRWIGSVNIEVLRSPDGEVAGAVNCFQDVTELHRRREQSSRDEAFLRALVEATPECINVVAPDGGLVDINAAGAAMYGLRDPEAARGLNLLDLVAPEDRQAWGERHRRICSGESASWEFDVQSLAGGRRRMETHAVPFRLGDGQTGHLGVTCDITERRKVETARRETEARHRAILESLPIALYTVDPQGRLTYCNRAAAEFAGREPEIGVDRWCVTSKLFTLDGEPLPQDQCPMAQAIRDGAPRLGVDEVIAEAPDGRRRRFIPFATPLRDPDGRIVGGLNMLADVTAIRAAEDALARRTREQASLYRFTDRLYRAPDAESAYEAALDAITEALGCARASLLLADAGGVMRFAAWRGLSQRYRAAVEGHSPWTPDVRDPEPIWVRDIEATDEPEPIKAAIRGEDIRALGFVPLVADGRLVGKFMVYYPDLHDFTAEESELALAVARQLGSSIERRRADERLRDQGDEFHALADNIPALCWMAYADGQVYWFNRRWYEYSGASPESQLGSGWTSLVDPAAQPKVMERWAHSLGTGEPFDMTFPLRAVDGEFRPHLTRVVPIRDGEGRIRRWFGTNTDVALQVRQQEHLKLLINELNHRVKNTLATVQSMASRSLRHAATAGEALDAFEGRLLALSRAHNLLTESKWEGANLEDLVGRALAPIAAPGSERVLFHGPAVWLTQRRAISLAMVLHELATNAMKYGALSSESGRLEVGWSVVREADGAACVRLHWRERGGPQVGPPDREGLGTRLIERTIRTELGGALDLNYEPEGLVWRAELPMDEPRSKADLAPRLAPGGEIIANWPGV
jgi:PAS domain S-box-containing protein